ncbi:hypothetical protein, partial [Mycobacterium sp.]|uniref:hypothetical protein n=1 Tax=Mycobacterium sp. TaxID=1785 RepID=UPI003342B67B
MRELEFLCGTLWRPFDRFGLTGNQQRGVGKMVLCQRNPRLRSFILTEACDRQPGWEPPRICLDDILRTAAGKKRTALRLSRRAQPLNHGLAGRRRVRIGPGHDIAAEAAHRCAPEPIDTVWIQALINAGIMTMPPLP